MSWFSDLLFGPEPPGADPLKSKAYLVYFELGPAWSIPRAERLAAKFPGVSPGQREAWMRDFAAVSRYVDHLAGQGGTMRRGEREVSAEIREKFPFLTRNAVSEVISRANYIAYH